MTLVGLEIYSTVLWHLRKEVDLSYVAHRVASLDNHSPQAWYECMDLNREDEF